MKKNLCKIAAISLTLAALFAGCNTKPAKITVSTDTTYTKIRDLFQIHEGNVEVFYNTENAISVGCGGTSCYTQDGGATWERGDANTTCRFCVDIVNENLFFSGGDEQKVCVTKDGGKTWEEVGTADCLPFSSIAIDFADEKNGWILGTSSEIAASDDGGATWKKMTLPESIGKISAINLRTKDIGYILARDGGLYKTTNGGDSFEKQVIDFSFCNAVSSDGVAGSLNDKTWVADMAFTDDNNGTIVFICRTDEALTVWTLTTSDGGKSFTAEQIDLPEGFQTKRVSISQDGTILSIGTKQRIAAYQKNK